MAVSPVMAAARTFFRETCKVTSFVDSLDGLHFNIPIGPAKMQRECWFRFNGINVVQFSVVLGPELQEEERKGLNAALLISSEIDNFFGVVAMGDGKTSMVFARPFNPSSGHLSHLLNFLVTVAAPADLHRVDILYPLAAQGKTPKEIVHAERTFGTPAGHA